MSLLSLLDTKQTTNSSRRPTFQGSRASCLQHPGGMWECAALGLLLLFCVKYHSLVVHSSSPVNLFLVQPFTPLCYGRKMNMNYSGGLFCNRTRPRPKARSGCEDLWTTALLCETGVKDVWDWGNWERRSEQGLWLKRGFEFPIPIIFCLNQRG